jgi:hypothetical protein
MENNDISNQLSSIIENTGNTTDFDFGSDSSSTSSWFQNIGITTWIIIILLFSFLGFNIFSYLEKGTDEVTTFLKPITNFIGSIFGKTTSQIVDVSAEGGKAVTGTVNKGFNAAQRAANNGESEEEEVEDDDKKMPGNPQVNALNKALNSSKPIETTKDYQADDSSSNIQRGTAKSGWCYIGEDRGFRTCANVESKDDCMSGDIFPSNEICMNPSLRA